MFTVGYQSVSLPFEEQKLILQGPFMFSGQKCILQYSHYLIIGHKIDKKSRNT